MLRVLTLSLALAVVHGSAPLEQRRARLGNIASHAQRNIELHTNVVKASDQTPRVYVIDNFLSETDIGQLKALADGGWDRQSATHKTLLLETWPRLAHSDVMLRIDERIAEYTGFKLEEIEEGYIQSYSGGFNPHNAHMDQNPDNMSPERVASIIFFLDTQPLGSGHTVFPLAKMTHERAQACELSHNTGGKPCSPDYLATGDTAKSDRFTNIDYPFVDKQRRDAVTKWDRALERGLEERDFFAKGEGTQLFEWTQAMCRLGFGVRPVAGRALVFINFENDGAETIRSVHGSCYLPKTSPPKNVLVKPLCAGPVRDTAYLRRLKQEL